MIRSGPDGLTDATHDLCVVGGGPVGIAMALESARQGRRVLLLESGGDGVEYKAQALSDASIVDPARHDSMRIAVARRLGGTSNLWGGRCLPYDPIDFEHRPIQGDTRWPIGLADITPFYARAVDYACAGADVFETSELTQGDDKTFATSSLERWSRDRKAQQAHGKALADSPLIDLRLNASVTGFVWDDDRVSHVVVVGPDARRTKIPVRDVVIATGGLESTRLLLSEQRDAPARFGGVDGALGRTYMGHVIGEIADIVFADDRTDTAFDFTIDAHGSYVRRRITPAPTLLRDDDLLNCAFWPVVPRVSDPTHRDGFLSAIALGLSVETLGARILPEAIRRRHIPVGMTRGPHAANVLRDLPAAAVEIPALLWKRYGAKIPAPAFYKRNTARRYGLSYHAEQAPRAASRVRLTHERDATGLPRLEIDLRFSYDDAASVVRLHGHMERWLAHTGLGRLDHRHPAADRAAAVLDQASHGTHQIGTARMAANAAAGVVDRDLCCFGAQNLYVASAAVLPTSGQANPTLTVMALGMRLVDRLAAGRPAIVETGPRSASPAFAL